MQSIDSFLVFRLSSEYESDNRCILSHLTIQHQRIFYSNVFVCGDVNIFMLLFTLHYFGSLLMFFLSCYFRIVREKLLFLVHRHHQLYLKYYINTIIRKSTNHQFHEYLEILKFSSDDLQQQQQQVAFRNGGMLSQVRNLLSKF